MDAGIQLDQAPPLAIPASFFVSGAVALVGAGVVLATAGDLFGHPLVPATIAVTHLGTLGFLTSTMFGAMYQMVPVVAGARVPAVRLAHGVHLAWVVGVVALVVGLWGFPAAVLVGMISLGAALLGFVVPVSVALLRAPATNATVPGMRLAVGSLVLAAGLGLFMASWHALGWFVLPRTTWITVHLAVGLLGWVGGLITSVSWQVVPMFYLGRPVPRWVPVAVRWAVVAGTVGPCVALTGPWWAAPVAAIPAAVAVWVAHPAAVLWSLAGRRRRRVDGSARFWWAGSALAPVVAVVGACAVVQGGWVALLFGWLAVFGWAGLIVHGMLLRIVPFLVWFHRFSALVGVVPGVPSMRDLVTEGHVRLGLVTHLVALGSGSVAIVSGSAMAARGTGVLVALTGLVLGVGLIRALATVPRGSP